jgi:hypothetical protein
MKEKDKLSLYRSLKTDLRREEYITWQIPTSHIASHVCGVARTACGWKRGVGSMNRGKRGYVKSALLAKWRQRNIFYWSVMSTIASEKVCSRRLMYIPGMIYYF